MKTKIKGIIKKIEIQDIAIFAIPFFTFIIALVIFFPGFLSYDSFQQLGQISAHRFSNWHPFIHTFIEMVCLKVWNSPASVGLFQIFCFSIIWTIICKYNRKAKTWYEFLIQIIITIIFSLNPLNVCYSITLWKDVLFSYGMLLLAFIIQVIIDKDFDASYYIFTIFGLLMAFVSKMRGNGLFAVVMLLLVLIVIMLIKKKFKKMLLLLALYVVGMFSIFGLEKIYNVENNEKSALNAKAFHVIAFYETQGYLSESDKTFLSEIIDTNEMTNNYVVSFSDPIYRLINQEKANEYRSKVIKIIAREAKNHPARFISYALDSSVMTWAIDMPEGTIGTTLWLTLDVPNNTNVKFANEDKIIFEKAMQCINFTLNNSISRVAFYSMSLYMYLSFVIMVFLVILKKAKYSLVIACNITNIVIVAASTPIQDIRYIYPNILMFYLLLIIMFNCIFNIKNEKNDNSIKIKR